MKKLEESLQNDQHILSSQQQVAEADSSGDDDFLRKVLPEGFKHYPQEHLSNISSSIEQSANFGTNRTSQRHLTFGLEQHQPQ